jgi:hypothetical protein
LEVLKSHLALALLGGWGLLFLVLAALSGLTTIGLGLVGIV